MAPLMEMAQRRGVPVLVHASEPVGHPYPGKGRTTPEALMGLIQDFPQATIICAHWGGGLPFYALMPEVAGALENVYFDSAASPFLYDERVFSQVAQLVRPQRLLFATDYPLIPPQRLLAQVRSCGLSPEVEAMVLGGNAARLLGLIQDGAPSTVGASP
jgi:predicted TIM-barrel fold metal-dependent hydrolase